MQDTVLKYYSWRQVPRIILVSVICTALGFELVTFCQREGKVFTELLKHGTPHSVPGKLRINLMILCILVLDRAWRSETFLSMRVLQSFSQDDLQFM